MTDNDAAVALVAAYRPALSHFDDEWGRARRADELINIFAVPKTSAPGPLRSTPSKKRLWTTVGALAACTVAAVAGSALLPVGSPGGPDASAAATLNSLAVAAGRHGGTVGRGQFAYVLETSEQTMSDSERSSPPLPGETRVGDLVRDTGEQWTAPDGTQWRTVPLDGGRACLAEHVHVAAAGTDVDYENASAAELAALPTDPQHLGEFIDNHGSGDNTGTRNRFMAVGDLLRSGLAAPPLRSAALRLLAHTNGLSVDTHAQDAMGRPATRVDYSFGYGIESLFFDAGSSRVLEEQTTQGRYLYRAVVRKAQVVDSIQSRLPSCPKPTTQPG